MTKAKGKAKGPQAAGRGGTIENETLPLLKTDVKEMWKRYGGNLPFASSYILREFIERQASPLAKVIAFANGESITNQDAQITAIYKLLPKVAPDLKVVEAAPDDPDSDETQSSEIIGKLIDALSGMAERKRDEEDTSVVLEHDGGTEEVVEHGPE